MSKLTQYKYSIIERVDIPPAEVFEQKCIDTSVEVAVDYVGNAIAQLESQEQMAKDGKKQLDEAIKSIKSDITRIKEGVSQSLINNGEKKLTGIAFSSITITEAKDSDTKEVRKFVTKLTKDEVNQLIFDSGQGYWEVSEETIEAKPTSIRINKKR